ncbi:MAG: hypothetical protein KDC98_26615 [Planctomycetes bacterium]|nr:hypothetical protein [Planctomycetota bacterium]
MTGHLQTLLEFARRTPAGVRVRRSHPFEDNDGRKGREVAPEFEAEQVEAIARPAVAIDGRDAGALDREREDGGAVDPQLSLGFDRTSKEGAAQDEDPGNRSRAERHEGRSGAVEPRRSVHTEQPAAERPGKIERHDHRQAIEPAIESAIEPIITPVETAPRPSTRSTRRDAEVSTAASELHAKAAPIERTARVRAAAPRPARTGDLAAADDSGRPTTSMPIAEPAPEVSQVRGQGEPARREPPAAQRRRDAAEEVAIPLRDSARPRAPARAFTVADPGAADASSDGQTVEIHIGRIDVRATPPAGAPPSARPRASGSAPGFGAAMGLDDYLRLQRGRR